jgi:hypothetical protein
MFMMYKVSHGKLKYNRKKLLSTNPYKNQTESIKRVAHAIFLHKI